MKMTELGFRGRFNNDPFEMCARDARAVAEGICVQLLPNDDFSRPTGTTTYQ
jgi:hypothetical protein